MANYWWLCADPDEWSFSQISEGEVKGFSNKSKKKKKANFAAAELGDMVIGYEAVKRKVVALLEVCEKDEEYLYFRKLEDVRNPLDYKSLLQHPELAEVSYFRWHSGTLFRLQKKEYDFIVDEIRKQGSRIEQYGKGQFLEEVYMDAARYDELVSVLSYKKNIILQGAPGVGKTHVAERLAYALMGGKEEARIAFVQFHQNYCYEDFVEGYRPDGEGGFKLHSGIFREFCEQAARQSRKEFFFIIDEINRGNMSKIFGELLMLIEKDYRGKEIMLPYSKEPFSVPCNLHIIGMMNTADRSLAMIDYALRRRFSFVTMEPAFGTPSFGEYQRVLGSPEFDALVNVVCALNKAIAEDSSLGSGFCIGHSYFCGLENEQDLPARLRAIVEYDIVPMLQEYWFDDKNALKKWTDALRFALP